MKISLDTEPAGKVIILCRNCNLRDSILEGSRFSPTMDSAISDQGGNLRETPSPGNTNLNHRNEK